MIGVVAFSRASGAIALAVVLACSGSATAQSVPPPPGSPLGMGQHPRLFVTASELPALRGRIEQHYKNDFQAFINLLNNTAALTTGQRGIEAHWGALNYAFLGLLDPAQMKLRGFTFAAHLDTAAEYCEKAMTYVRPQLLLVRAHKNQAHDALTEGYPKPIYFPIAAAYDWCYGQISTTDRMAVVDAFITVYTDWYANKDLLRMEVYSEMLANNQASALIHNTLGILAFYNDPYPASDVQQKMYDVFDAMWIKRTMGEINTLYAWGTNWHEGPTNYFTDSFTNIAIPMAMAAPALGRNIIGTTPFFYRHPEFAEANAKPLNLLPGCGASGTALCPPVIERWGTESNITLDCKTEMLSAGLLRHVGHANAALAKWVHQQTMAGAACDAAVKKYGGSWSNGVLYAFLYGNREIDARSPTELAIPASRKLGLGQYIFRSGFDAAASQVVFWAPDHRTYGHNSPEYGSFTLHKFGNLILKPSNCKSGDAVLQACKFNLMTNSMGIHWGASNLGLANNGFATLDPTFAARGMRSVRVAGKVLADTVGNGLVDYVSYDSAPSWNPATVSIAQRELAYLHGPTDSEYVVVFDRVLTPAAATDEKVWKVWVPAEPIFENGTVTTTPAGIRTSANARTISMTNQASGLATPQFASPATHGKFYLTSLWPQHVTINVVGGPGKEFQSANNDGTTPWGAPVLSAGMREYLGWGRIEIRPTVAQPYDTLLNVIQFGDAATLAAKASVSRVDSSDGAMIGSHVRDSQNEWVVMFGAAKFDPAAGLTATQYAFAASAPTSRHLIANLAPWKTYYVGATTSGANTTVRASTTPLASGVPVTASAGGAIAFAVTGTQIVGLDAAAPTPPPNGIIQAVTNLRVVH